VPYLTFFLLERY